MVGKTDDVAALEAQIAAEKDKAIQAHAELERLEAAHRAAADYEAATALDHAIAQQRWTIRHADNVIPELESRLAAAASIECRIGKMPRKPPHRLDRQRLQLSLDV